MEWALVEDCENKRFVVVVVVNVCDLKDELELRLQKTGYNVKFLR